AVPRNLRNSLLNSLIPGNFRRRARACTGGDRFHGTASAATISAFDITYEFYFLGVKFSPLSRGLWRMHFSLTPWRRFPGHSLPLSVLESRSRLSVVRASPTAWSPGTIFRSSRLRARHQITGCPWANKVALFADPSCGEEHRAGPGMESKGRATGVTRTPARLS